MSENNFKFIKLEKKGKVCILQFNRPEKKNPLSSAMRSEIIVALGDLESDKGSYILWRRGSIHCWF